MHTSTPASCSRSLTLTAATVVTGLAAGFFYTYEASVVRGLLLAAPLLFLVAIAITATGNVPLNDDLAVLDIASSPGAVADARDAFEDDWNRLNRLRALASFASFLAVVAALGTVAPTRPVGQTE